MHSSFSKSRRSWALGSVIVVSALAFSACDKATSDDPPADPNALITLTYPKGGETIKIGEVKTITWTVKDDQVNAVDIQVSADSGKTWKYVRTNSIPVASTELWGHFPWTVPATLESPAPAVSLAGKQCLLRVMQYSTSDVNMISKTKTTFTVSAP